MISKTLKSNLNYRIIGDGYPVVFLHGFLESISMWDRLEYPEETMCIFIDLPGHGNSKLEENDVNSLKDVAIKVAELLVELKVQEYSVVGHSMGGYVGLELMTLQTKCNFLLLLNSNFWEDSALKKRDRERVAQIVKKNKTLFIYEAIPNLFYEPQKFDSEVKNLIKEAKSISSNTISKYALAMANRKDFSQFVKENQAKLKMIHGEFDSVIPAELLNEKTIQMTGLDIEMSLSGHMTHIEDSEFVNKNLIELKKRKY